MVSSHISNTILKDSAVPAYTSSLACLKPEIASNVPETILAETIYN